MFDAWKRFEHLRLKPWLQGLRPYRQRRYGNVEVLFTKNLDGGGNSFVEEFFPVLQAWGMPKQRRVFEWCAGPGFIGFAMLGLGLCESLCLADINPAAVKAAERTVQENGLDGRVAVYRSDGLSSIPATERWDLVLGNPPHLDAEWHRGHLITYDGEWRAHREFFAAVGRFLNPGGVIVLQENSYGSSAETFRSMIEAAGLRILFVRDGVRGRTAENPLYYLGIARRGDTLPGWAMAAGS
jgi:methylase of polypeptide subunit release factors